MKKERYHVLGMMSGTSLDGLDMACCTFEFAKGRWNHSILEAVTIPYNEAWKKRLSDAATLPAPELLKLDKQYGTYLGKLANDFIRSNGLGPTMIASHGHTIFHKPLEGLTLQIGDGWSIYAETGLKVVHDFRSLDVALGGQGAPLVPVGDRLLFSGHRCCLNLGGIANISFEKNEKRIAFDICPVNMLLNFLSAKVGKAFDADGLMASSGKIDRSLLDALNGLSFYRAEPPKSLGREWFESEVLPLLNRSKASVNDMLRTSVEHIADQLAAAIPAGQAGDSLLITGGGAHNGFLTGRLREKTGLEMFIPGRQLVDFKEALVFAFLAVLKVRGEHNTYASVTGASRDSCGGNVISEG